jgi:hypothetical protein
MVFLLTISLFMQDLDLEPIIESTSDGISIDNLTIHGGYKQSNPSQNPTYHTLMNKFGLLAEVDCCWGSSPPPIQYFQILLVVTHMLNYWTLHLTPTKLLLNSLRQTMEIVLMMIVNIVMISILWRIQGQIEIEQLLPEVLSHLLKELWKNQGTILNVVCENSPLTK